MSGFALPVSFLLLSLSALALFGSCATTDWLHGDFGDQVLHIGLWRSCLGPDCVSNFDADGEIMEALGPWMWLCQGCSIIGVFVISVTLTVMFVYGCNHNHNIIPWVTLLTFISAMVYGLSVLIFCLEAYDTRIVFEGSHALHLGYSLYVALAGSVIGLLASALMIGEAHVRRDKAVSRKGYVQLN